MDWLKIFKRPSKRSAIPRRLRGFTSASTGRLLNGWTTSAQRPDAAIKDGLVALRARSRDSYLNNPFARKFVSLVRENIVGPNGVSMQARSVGMDGKPDTLANEAIEAGWKEWGRRETCDLNQSLGWVDMQRQAITTCAIDGEILARGVTGTDVGGRFTFSIQHIDPILLDPSYSAKLRNGNIVKMGIEYDNLGRKVAYHLLTSDASVGYAGQNGRRYQPIPADQIIHAYRADQVDQTRGYPWMSTVLDMFKMLDSYFENAMVAARAGAAKMGFITSGDGASYTGDDTDSDGSVISEFEPGILEQLAEGQGFTAFDPKYPHEMFSEFVKSCLQQISSGIGVSYHSLSNSLEGVSFSSIRTGVIDERVAWTGLQNWFITGYCVPVFEMWLDSSLLAGALTVNGSPLKVKLDPKYQAVTWQGRRWSWVDPLKDITMHKTAIEAGISTVSAAIRELGRDPEEVFRERAWEKELMGSLGLTDDDAMKAIEEG